MKFKDNVTPKQLRLKMAKHHQRNFVRQNHLNSISNFSNLFNKNEQFLTINCMNLANTLPCTSSGNKRLPKTNLNMSEPYINARTEPDFMPSKSEQKQRISNLHFSKSSSNVLPLKTKSNSKSKSKNSKCIISASESQKSLLKKTDIQGFSRKVRKMNKKFISREMSSENLQMRNPWGTNQLRLNSFVLQTLNKMQNLKKAKNDRKEETFHTAASGVKIDLTPKKAMNQCLKRQPKQKIIKSPIFEERTDPKTKQKCHHNLSEEKPTQKQTKKSKKSETVKKSSQNKEQAIENKVKKTSELIWDSFKGNFECIYRSSNYSINYRVLKRKIIEIEVEVLKKIETLTVNLCKGSLQCQSINQTYENIVPKSSIILMSAVSGKRNGDKFIFPQIQIIASQKNNSFAQHQKIEIPYNWMYLIDIIPTELIKETKTSGKIKNKSCIENARFSKQILGKLESIFEGNYLKQVSKNRDCSVYSFGFRLEGELNLLKLAVFGQHCNLQCESSSDGRPHEVIELFQSIFLL